MPRTVSSSRRTTTAQPIARSTCSRRRRGTNLTLTFAGLPRSLPARLFAPLGFLMLGVVRRQLASDLADLAREAEHRHGQATAIR